MRTIDEIRSFAVRCFSDARGSHDWDHTQRVFNLCMHIGRAEGVDLRVLEIASYLHDVGRSRKRGRKWPVSCWQRT